MQSNHDRDPGLSPAATRVLFGCVLFLAVAAHLAHSVYDGRIILDHDQIFLDLFHNIHIAEPSEGSVWKQLALGWGSSFAYFYLLISSLLTSLHALGVTVDLLTYRLVNLAFYALLLFGGYRLGSLLAGRRVGLLAAAAIAALPVIDNFSRSYTIHFHLTALMLMAQVEMIRLLRDRHATTPYPLLGVWCGLATLVHPIGLMQSAPIFLFLAIHLVVQRKTVSRKLLKFALALLPLLPLTAPVLRKLTHYSASRVHFLSVSAFSFQSLTRNFIEWLHEISLIFFGPAYLALFGALAGVGVYHLARARSRHPADLYLAAILAVYTAMALLVRLNAGFTADFMIIHALLICLTLALAWREWSGRPGAKVFLPALAAAVVLLGGAYKAGRVDVFPADQYVAPRQEFVYHQKIVVEPDWIFSIEHAFARAGLPVAVPVGFYRERLDPTSSRPNEIATTYLMQTGLQLLGRHAVLVGQDEPARVRLELYQLDRPYTARETARLLTERVGRQPGDFAAVQWFVKNGMYQTYGLNTENALFVLRFTSPGQAH